MENKHVVKKRIVIISLPPQKKGEENNNKKKRQIGTKTLMRTVKKTHNITLREKVRLGEMGLKYCCVVKIGLQKIRAI